jgi:hypothetical protein
LKRIFYPVYNPRLCPLSSSLNVSDWLLDFSDKSAVPGEGVQGLVLLYKQGYFVERYFVLSMGVNWEVITREDFGI